jgi:hypothetical protein
VLKVYGWLRIAEPISHWEGGKRADLLGALDALGFQGAIDPSARGP